MTDFDRRDFRARAQAVQAEIAALLARSARLLAACRRRVGSWTSRSTGSMTLSGRPAYASRWRHAGAARAATRSH
jgi:hypothetical protein